MYYLIDGYNFLFRIHSSKGKSLEQRRESLIDLLSDELSGFKGQCAIVFDSAEQIRDFPESIRQKNLDVIYAPRGSTADEYIIEMVEQTKNPKSLAVVTSDKGLARQCGHIGSEVFSIEDFLILAAKKKKKKKSSSKPQYRESKQEFERLKKIFEEKLTEDGKGIK